MKMEFQDSSQNSGFKVQVPTLQSGFQEKETEFWD